MNLHNIIIVVHSIILISTQTQFIASFPGSPSLHEPGNEANNIICLYY